MLTRRALIATVAAAPALAQGAPKRGGTLKVSVAQRLAQLNPLKLSSNSEYISAALLYNSLTRLGMDMVPQPALATSWSANGDATEFTFQLRPGVRFHDGQVMTADDVAATFRAILDPKTGSPARSAIGPITEVIPDGNAVRIRLSSPFADLPVAMAHPNARIVPARIATGDINVLSSTAVGTGPFKLETYDSSRLLRVVRNPAYFVPDRPYLDAVEQYLYPDLAAESGAFLARQTDVMLEVGQADYRRIAGSPGVTGQRVKTGRYACLVLRMDTKPFDDVRVRRALAMSIDRPALIDLVLDGFGQVAWDNPISPEYRYHAEVPHAAYDPAAARKLLAEAGYTNSVKATLTRSDRPAIRQQLGVAVKELTKEGGFDITVQTVPNDFYIANVWRKGPFYVGYWNMRPTEDIAFTLLFTSDGAFADSAWNNKPFDELVAQARRTQDPAERKRLYTEAQALMSSELPYIIPFFQDVLTASRSDVRGYTVHPTQLDFPFEQVWLDRG
jgi:peptide/nickel transport system substrate-binding protein